MCPKHLGKVCIHTVNDTTVKSANLAVKCRTAAVAGSSEAPQRSAIGTGEGERGRERLLTMERRGCPAEQGCASAAGKQSHLMSDDNVRAGSPPILLALPYVGDPLRFNVNCAGRHVCARGEGGC